MSKMACRCGRFISDVISPSPTEGFLVREQDEEAFYGRVARDITAFFKAVAAGERTSWIQGFFAPTYPTALGDEGVVQDIITTHTRGLDLSVCECAACGRLYVQRGNGENYYIGFAPDEPGYKGILHSERAASTLPRAAADLGTPQSESGES
jgi:hypothetical protein